MPNVFLNLKRIIFSGIKNFIRNGWLSVATTSIMALTLIVIGVLLVLNVVMNGTVEYLEDRLDISVYFKPDTTEDVVLDIQSDLDNLSEVTEVRYVSKDEGLYNLLESKNIEERDSIQSGIEEIGVNPLGHTLNVQTVEPSQFGIVEDFLSQDAYREVISKISVKEDIINKVDRTATIIKGVGLGLSLLFALISVLITFNAIRITIHNFRSEIEIMRLVGASHWFIRFPFMVEGILYGVLAGIITLAVLYPSIHFVSDKISTSVPTLDLEGYFNQNFLLMTLFLLSIGTVIGAVSSTFAIRRYLKEAEEEVKKKKKGKRKK